MKVPVFIRHWRAACGTAMVCAAAASALFGVSRHADAGPAKASRYPYDPVCEWGRLSNGRGMLVRCLTKAEAAALSTASGPTAATPSAASPETGKSVPLKADVAGITVDQGALPVAQKKLREANARFAECVEKEGGLTATRGEVHVRFLVRARGRAEGVSVSKRVGVGESAARCVAHVVDRRWVGTPDVPIVGGTAVIRLEKR
jgi:hypothetical protein